MKLLIVTVVEQFQSDVLELFKKAEIKNFSGSDIDGYKSTNSILMNSSWFPSEKSGAESSMFFSYTDEGKIDTFFDLVKNRNATIETNNPIRAIVVPIERYI